MKQEYLDDADYDDDDGDNDFGAAAGDDDDNDDDLAYGDFNVETSLNEENEEVDEAVPDAIAVENPEEEEEEENEFQDQPGYDPKKDPEVGQKILPLSSFSVAKSAFAALNFTAVDIGNEEIPVTFHPKRSRVKCQLSFHNG